MNLNRLLLTLLCMAPCLPQAWSAQALAPKADEYRVLKKITLGGDGFWDYLTADPIARRLYIARGDRIMVVDIDSGKLVGEIKGIDGAHGVALVPDLNRAFATSGRDGTVRVIDLKTLNETSKLKAGAKPDAVIYDSASKRVFAFNNGGTTATVIDPAEAKVLQDVELGGAPEFAVADGKGKVFVNLEDKSEIVEIDTAGMKAANHWPLAPGESPTGLAIDAAHRRLFSGCHNKTLVVMDADNGKIVASLPIGAGVDAVAFDPEAQNAFSSNGDGTLTVIHETDPNTFKVIQTVQTQSGARTCTLDEKTHQIWLVTADTEPAPNSTVPQNRQHRSLVPGSFTAIVVGK